MNLTLIRTSFLKFLFIAVIFLGQLSNHQFDDDSFIFSNTKENSNLTIYVSPSFLIDESSKEISCLTISGNTFAGSLLLSKLSTKEYQYKFSLGIINVNSTKTDYIGRV